MTIRSRLLFLVLPVFAVFLILISSFFYVNWSNEIQSSLKTNTIEEKGDEGEVIHKKLEHAGVIILIAAGVTFLFVTLTVFIIADRISRPVRQLNRAALRIAAGDYQTHVKVEGPKEIAELSQTLNTMSECLVEHMSRLAESSLIKERMIGESECAILLQHYLLHKIAEDFSHPHLRIKLISVPQTTVKKGLMLKISKATEPDLTITFVEANEPGFDGLFKLNQKFLLKESEFIEEAYTQCTFLDDYTRLHFSTQRFSEPLIWSIDDREFYPLNSNEVSLNNNDMIFLCNNSLIEHFNSRNKVELWLGRVLRHFVEDGIEAIQTMLRNELHFLTKKQQIKSNFQIVSLQVRNNQLKRNI